MLPAKPPVSSLCLLPSQSTFLLYPSTKLAKRLETSEKHNKHYIPPSSLLPGHYKLPPIAVKQITPICFQGSAPHPETGTAPASPEHPLLGSGSPLQRQERRHGLNTVPFSCRSSFEKKTSQQQGRRSRHTLANSLRGESRRQQLCGSLVLGGSLQTRPALCFQSVLLGEN